MASFLNYIQQQQKKDAYPDSEQETQSVPTYGYGVDPNNQTQQVQQPSEQDTQPTQTGMNISQLAQLLGPSPQERLQQEENERKRTINNEKWNAFFNGLRGLGNLYYTTKSATPQRLNDTTQQIEQQYQNERARRLQAQQQEQAYRQQLYNMYSKEGDRQFKQGATLAQLQNAKDANAERNRHNMVYENTMDNKLAEDIRKNKVSEGQSQQKINNSKQYQQGQLSIGQQRNKINADHNAATEGIALAKLNKSLVTNADKGKRIVRGGGDKLYYYDKKYDNVIPSYINDMLQYSAKGINNPMMNSADKKFLGNIVTQFNNTPNIRDRQYLFLQNVHHFPAIYQKIKKYLIPYNQSTAQKPTQVQKVAPKPTQKPGGKLSSWTDNKNNFNLGW